MKGKASLVPGGKLLDLCTARKLWFVVVLVFASAFTSVGQAQADLKLLAPDGTADDQFGFSADVAGDTAIVGAWEDDRNGSSSGSAYVFARDQGGADNWGPVKKLVGSDVRVLTDAEEEGTYEGVFGAGAYLSQIWTKGEEWNVGAKLSFRWNFSNWRFDHGFLLGGEYTYDNNTGQGKIIDPFYPPHGNPGQRPLPFDYSPALKNASLYFEDEIKGSLNFRPWSLILGARYEMYTPSGINWGGLFSSEEFVESNNGSFNFHRFVDRQFVERVPTADPVGYPRLQ